MALATIVEPDRLLDKRPVLPVGSDRQEKIARRSDQRQHLMIILALSLFLAGALILFFSDGNVTRNNPDLKIRINDCLDNICNSSASGAFATHVS